MPTTTHDLISTTTVGSATSTITFSGLTSAYNNYRIIAMPRITSDSTAIVLRFNNDSLNNYTFIARGTEGNGNPAVTAQFSATSYINLMYNTGTSGLSGSDGAGVLIVDIQGASDTNWYTYAHAYISTRDNASASGGVGITSGNYVTTDQITSISLVHINTTFAVGTVVSLYGLVA